MPWYFYNGQVPVPVKTANGTVVSVPPRGHIEADPQAVKKYGSKMRRCAPPKSAVEAQAKTPKTIIEPPKAGPLAAKISEKTKSPPPKVAPKAAQKDAPKVAEASKAPKRRTRTKTPK